MQLAKQVIGTFEKKLDLADYRDEYREGLQKIIDAKIAGEEVVAPGRRDAAEGREPDGGAEEEPRYRQREQEARGQGRFESGQEGVARGAEAQARVERKRKRKRIETAALASVYSFFVLRSLSSSLMRFVVLGAGAIGGVVGGRLAQHGHDVVLIARGAHYEAIRDNGLRIESPDEATTLRIPVVDGPSGISWSSDDVLLLATKTQDTEAALDALASVAPRTLPILCAAEQRRERAHGGGSGSPTSTACSSGVQPIT